MAFPTGWTKRKRITLTSNDSTAKSGQVWDFWAIAEPSMAEDYADVRFVLDGSNDLLRYYITSRSTAGFRAYVEIPGTVAGLGSVDFWMYYGNATEVTAQDPVIFAQYGVFLHDGEAISRRGVNPDAATHHWADSIVTFGNKVFVFFIENYGSYYLSGLEINTDTGEAIGPVLLSTLVVNNDAHGYASACITDAGELHLFYGAHNSAFHWRHVQAVDGLWGLANITPGSYGSGATYPSVFSVGDDVFIAYRAPGIHSTQSAYFFDVFDGDSWAGPTKLIEVNDGVSRNYSRMYKAKNGRLMVVHTSRLTNDNLPSAYRHIAYMESVDNGATWRRADGSAIAIPCFPTSMDLVWPGVSGDYTGVSHMCADSDVAGTPVILFKEQNGLDTDYFLSSNHWIARWNGTAWDCERINATANTMSDSAVLQVLGDGSYRVVSEKKSGANTELVVNVSADGGATWAETVLTSDGNVANRQPMLPRGHITDDLILVYMGVGGDVVLRTDRALPVKRWSVAGGRIAFSGEVGGRLFRETVNSYAISPVSALPQEFVLDFRLRTITKAVSGAYAFFGLSSASQNVNGNSADMLLVEYQYSTGVTPSHNIGIRFYDGGVGTKSATTIGAGDYNRYFARFERKGSTAKLSLFSDPARTSHVAGSPITHTIPSTVAGLDRLLLSNFNSAVANCYIDAYYSDVVCFSHIEAPTVVFAAEADLTGTSLTVLQALRAQIASSLTSAADLSAGIATSGAGNNDLLATVATAQTGLADLRTGVATSGDTRHGLRLAVATVLAAVQDVSIEIAEMVGSIVRHDLKLEIATEVRQAQDVAFSVASEAATAQTTLAAVATAQESTAPLTVDVSTLLQSLVDLELRIESIVTATVSQDLRLEIATELAALQDLRLTIAEAGEVLEAVFIDYCRPRSFADYCRPRGRRLQ